MCSFRRRQGSQSPSEKVEAEEIQVNPAGIAGQMDTFQCKESEYYEEIDDQDVSTLKPGEYSKY